MTIDLTNLGSYLGLIAMIIAILGYFKRSPKEKAKEESDFHIKFAELNTKFAQLEKDVCELESKNDKVNSQISDLKELINTKFQELQTIIIKNK